MLYIVSHLVEASDFFNLKPNIKMSKALLYYLSIESTHFKLLVAVELSKK